MLNNFFATRLLGIIGHPLRHSLSPMLHNAMCDALGVDAVYLPWPMPQDRLDAFMQAVRTLPIHGCSVTIPHKEAVMPLCDRLTARARDVGAVNTLYWEDGALVGENTDVTGFIAPLAALGGRIGAALVLGAGGAARAAVAGLQRLGVPRIGVANRTAARSADICRDLGGEALSWEARFAWGAELVVNTTPLGMAGSNVHESPWEASAFAPGMLAYDMVYNPLQTRFLAQAEAAGCRTVSGLEMFVQQAAAQFRLWTGLEMDIALARRLCSQALAHG